MRSWGSFRNAALIHYPNSTHTGRFSCTNHHKHTLFNMWRYTCSTSPILPHVKHTQNLSCRYFYTDTHSPTSSMLKPADETFPKSWQLAGKEIPLFLSLSMQSDKKNKEKRGGWCDIRVFVGGIKKQWYTFHHHTLLPLYTHVHMLLHNDTNKLNNLIIWGFAFKFLFVRKTLSCGESHQPAVQRIYHKSMHKFVLQNRDWFSCPTHSLCTRSGLLKSTFCFKSLIIKTKELTSP